MAAEYPKALYRDGGSEPVWGLMLAVCTAQDGEEEKALLAAGWRVSPDPLDHDADGAKGGRRKAVK